MMQSHPSWIEHWVSTGELDFSDFVKNKSVGSTTKSDDSWLPPIQEGISVLKSEPEDELLVGLQNDPLIPSPDKIFDTFRKGQMMWHSYIACANSLPWGSVDPYLLLQNIPALPHGQPKRYLRGQAIWQVDCPELNCKEGEWNPNYTYGAQKSFPLFVHQPTQLRLSPESAFQLDKSQNNVTAVLVALWSYIFSVHLLEMQRRKGILYSSTIQSPIVGHDFDFQPGDIVIYLENASTELMRWLAAILAPGLGWVVSGPLPPWVAYFSEDTRFVIATDKPYDLCPILPPSSKQAGELFIEFCTMYDIGSSTSNDEKASETVPQPIAAFLAVLALPLYNSMGSQPQLPIPRTATRCTSHTTLPRYVRNYVDDLPYYMTLSVSPESIGSTIWSIFWEPGVDCNLSSAWFSSILEVLEPIIRAGDLEALAKVFMARRQLPALLWLGVFILGDIGFLKKITSYLETHDEQPGGSWSRPDVDVAAWTGCKQSFLDEDCAGPYIAKDSQVPRPDLVRSRFNFRVGDPDAIRYGWQPMGYVTKEEIEPELWQRLETKSSRMYHHWVWWLPEKDVNGSKQMMPQNQYGFIHDKAWHLSTTSNDSKLDGIALALPEGPDRKIIIGPSRDATFSIISYGAKDAAGDRSLETIVQGARNHQWLAGSRGI